MSVHQRSGVVFISEYPCLSAVEEEPYALDGTFRRWWIILVGSLKRVCFWNQ
jgi:hypothetical protein